MKQTDSVSQQTGGGLKEKEECARGRFLQHETRIHMNRINILSSTAQVHHSIIKTQDIQCN